MPLIVFIYELLIAIVVFVILNAIGNASIAFVIAAVLFIIMMTNTLNNPYK